MRRTVLLLLALCAFVFCSTAEDNPVTAQQELSAAIGILKSHQINRDKVDWPSIDSKANARLTGAQTAPDAYPAIRFVIGQLGIRHTFLVTADAYKAMTSGKRVGDATPPNPKMADTSLLAPGIGMLRLPGFVGTEAQARAYVGAVRRGLSDFAAQGICRYVVDLRGNLGGDMYPMLNAAQALLGRQPYGYWVSDRNNALAWHIPNAPTQWNAGQLDLADYAEPVTLIPHAHIAVLIDRKTASSGEFTAIAFEGMKNARVFGEPSAGFVTADEPFALPDGARLMVSTAWATDRGKRPYPLAVVPDEETAPGEPTIDAAVNWLKMQRCK